MSCVRANVVVISRANAGDSRRCCLVHIGSAPFVATTVRKFRSQPALGRRPTPQPTTPSRSLGSLYYLQCVRQERLILHVCVPCAHPATPQSRCFPLLMTTLTQTGTVSCSSCPRTPLPQHSAPPQLPSQQPPVHVDPRHLLPPRQRHGSGCAHTQPGADTPDTPLPG